MSSLHHARLLVALLAITLQSFGNAASTCFGYSGDVVDNHAPCNEAAAGSACCDVNDICLSNGYCLQVQTNFANRLGTPSCTDRSWESPACPVQCKDGMGRNINLTPAQGHSIANEFPPAAYNGAVSLYLAFDKSDGDFCCAESYDSSSQTCPIAPSQPFTLENGQVIFNRSDGSILYANTTSQLMRIEATQGTAAVVTTTAVQTAPASGNSVTAVGAGVGVALGVLLIASLVACGILYRQLKRLKSLQNQQVSYNMGPPRVDRKVGYHEGSYASHTTQLDSNPIYQVPNEREAVEADSRPY